jgi:hypothetical protein
LLQSHIDVRRCSTGHGAGGPRDDPEPHPMEELLLVFDDDLLSAAQALVALLVGLIR